MPHSTNMLGFKETKIIENLKLHVDEFLCVEIMVCMREC